MLRAVVKRRSEELKEYLTDENLEPAERTRKAKNLADGIELLFLTVKRGQDFKRLCTSISKIWVEVVIDVDDLGEEGEQPVKELINIFSRKLTYAFETRDALVAECGAHAGLELIKAAAMNPKKMVLNKFSDEWVRLWRVAIDANMRSIPHDQINVRYQEYHTHITEGNYDKALALGLAGMRILQDTLQQGLDTASGIMRHFVSSGIQGVVRKLEDRRPGSPGYVKPQEGSEEDIHARMRIGMFFNAAVDLFSVGEEAALYHLNPLILDILELAEVFLNRDMQGLVTTVRQRIESACGTFQVSLLERQLMPIATILMGMLNAALYRQGPGIGRSLELLKGLLLGRLSGALSNLTERSELARYTKAIEFLKT